MRFYTQQHRFYCGVDLHARTMYLCILNAAGQVVFDRNFAADPAAFRKPSASLPREPPRLPFSRIDGVIGGRVLNAVPKPSPTPTKPCPTPTE